MQIKINHEIRNYQESVFFGLTLRQFIFSACAIAAAVGLHFLFSPKLGTETVSWICILGAAPFAFFGFFKYNGLSAEKFISAWIKSEILTPRYLLYRSKTVYAKELQQTGSKREKEGFAVDKDTCQYFKI